MNSSINYFPNLDESVIKMEPMEPTEVESNLKRKIEENISMECEIKEEPEEKKYKIKEEPQESEENETFEIGKTSDLGACKESEENEIQKKVKPETDENLSEMTQTFTCEYVKKILSNFDLLPHRDVVDIEMENKNLMDTSDDKKKEEKTFEEIVKKSNAKSVYSKRKILQSEEIDAESAKLYNGLLLKDLQKAERLVEKEVDLMSQNDRRPYFRAMTSNGLRSQNSKFEYFNSSELIAAKRRIREEENIIKDLVAQGDLHIEGLAMFWKEYLSQLEC